MRNKICASQFFTCDIRSVEFNALFYQFNALFYQFQGKILNGTREPYRMKRKELQGNSSRKKRQSRCRQRCGHCQHLLSNSQYHEHRRLYFNPSLNQWKTVDSKENKQSSASHSVPEDVPGSSSSESEGKLYTLNSISA